MYGRRSICYGRQKWEKDEGVFVSYISIFMFVIFLPLSPKIEGPGSNSDSVSIRLEIRNTRDMYSQTWVSTFSQTSRNLNPPPLQ